MSQNRNQSKPNLHKRLFWEFDFEAINWLNEYVIIIQRVIERGTLEEWDELIHFYGHEKVIKTIKNEINYLPDEIISEVCQHFKLETNELRCYIRKQSLPKHWI